MYISPEAETNILPAFVYLVSTLPVCCEPWPTTTADMKASGSNVLVEASKDPVRPQRDVSESKAKA